MQLCGERYSCDRGLISIDLELLNPNMGSELLKSIISMLTSPVLNLPKIEISQIKKVGNYDIHRNKSDIQFLLNLYRGNKLIASSREIAIASTKKW
jgi:hypothetical protein